MSENEGMITPSLTDVEQLLLAYYGDDFTGSTDALEFLSNAGIKTLLFTEPPSKEQLQRYPGLQAIGVAGMTRSMSPVDMENALRPAFSGLRSLNPRHVHYKVCSTFDSSPHIGSIGKAIEIGAELFAGPYVPLLVAAPALGRYCVFGNLFARMGAGSAGEIFRLDRHPSMSRHPVTPADESDLRLHLAKQTSLRIGLFDILQPENDLQQMQATLNRIIKDGSDIVLFDGLYEYQMEKIGALIDNSRLNDATLFSVGSSGIEMALGNYWVNQRVIKAVEKNVDISDKSDRSPIEAKTLQIGSSSSSSQGQAGTTDPLAMRAFKHPYPLLVISGSCSPVTQAQIMHAKSIGFEEIIIDRKALERIATGNGYTDTAIDFLKEGKNVVVHTGGNDTVKADPEASRIFGTSLGTIARVIAETGLVKRIIVAGGDTAGYAARAMGIEAVEMIAPLSPGAPLCRAHAPASSLNGLEVNFKGGQVGAADYFEKALYG